MKKKGILVAFLVAVLVLTSCLAVACNGDEGELALNPESVSVVEGNTTTITAVTDSDEAIEWSVSNTEILSIKTKLGKLCVVNALKPGEAEVIARQGENEARSTVTVTSKASQPRVEIYYNDSIVSEITVEQDKTVQLSARVVNSNETVSLWASSNEAKATVSNTGLVTALLPGTVTITAVVNSSLFADVQVEVTAKAGSVYYDMKYAEEKNVHVWNDKAAAFNGEETVKEDEFFYWSCQSGWGQQVDVASAYVLDGTVHMSYTSDWDPGYWWGCQIYYKNSKLTKGSYYQLNCKINVNEACTVTLNDTVVELQKGDNNVEVYFKLTAGLNEEGTSSFDLALGYNDGTKTGAFLKDGEIVISDVEWTEITERKTLAAPSFTLDNNVITITDTNTEGVGAYRLVFLQDSAEKGSIYVENGKAIDMKTIAKGTYTVKLQAVAKDVRYIDSALSETSVEIVKATGAEYALPNNDVTPATGAPGTWTYWTESWVDFEGTYANDVLTATFGNNSGNWYDTQLFYKHPGNSNGQLYVLTFDLELIDANGGRVTINGKVITLQQGKHSYKSVYVEGDGASIAIVFGVNGESNQQEIQAATVKISNVVFTEAEPTALQAPTFTVGENNVITITDPNTDAEVSGYELAFYKENETEPSYIVRDVKSGSAVDLQTVAKGTYSVKIRAIGDNILYTDSAWSESAQTIVSTTEHPTVDIQYGENGYTWAPNDAVGPEGDATKHPDKWYYWNDKNTNGSTVQVSNAKIIDGVVTVEYACSAGKNDFGVQLFYDYSANEAGNLYKLTLTIKAAANVTVKVNGQSVSLVAGVAQTVEVKYTEPALQQYQGASIVIQVAVNNGDSNKIEVSNVSVEATEADPIPEGQIVFGENGEGKIAITHPDTWYYWNDQWLGSHVEVSSATYVDGVVSVTYSGTGSCDQGLQLFYDYSANVAGKLYTLELKITSSIANTVKISGQSIALEAGVEKAISIKITEPAIEQYAGATISIQVPVADNGGTITIKDVSVAEVVNDHTIDEGTYVLPDGITLSQGEEGGSVDKLVYWYVAGNWEGCGSVVTLTTATYENGAITLTYSGGSTNWCVQLFHKNIAVAAGTKATITLKINASAAGSCTVNGQGVTLVEGDNDVEVEFTVGEISLLDVQFGASETEVTYVVSNISWEIAPAEEPGQGGEQGEQPGEGGEQGEQPGQGGEQGEQPGQGGEQGEQPGQGEEQGEVINFTSKIENVEPGKYYGEADGQLYFHIYFNQAITYDTLVVTYRVNDGQTDKTPTVVNPIDDGASHHVHVRVEGSHQDNFVIVFNYKKGNVVVATGTFTYEAPEVPSTPFEAITLAVGDYTCMEWYGGKGGEFIALKIEKTDDNSATLAELKLRFASVKIDGAAGIAPGEFIDCGTFYRINVPIGTTTQGATYVITLLDSNGEVLATINGVSIPEDVHNAAIENA